MITQNGITPVLKNPVNITAIAMTEANKLPLIKKNKKPNPIEIAKVVIIYKYATSIPISVAVPLNKS